MPLYHLLDSKVEGRVNSVYEGKKGAPAALHE